VSRTTRFRRSAMDWTTTAMVCRRGPRPDNRGVMSAKDRPQLRQRRRGGVCPEHRFLRGRDGLDNDCDGPSTRSPARQPVVLAGGRNRPQPRSTEKRWSEPGPACTEVCDGLHNDCDGAVDEDRDTTVVLASAKGTSRTASTEQCVPGNSRSGSRWP
jgi:hypothetical protein